MRGLLGGKKTVASGLQQEDISAIAPTECEPDDAPCTRNAKLKSLNRVLSCNLHQVTACTCNGDTSAWNLPCKEKERKRERAREREREGEGEREREREGGRERERAKRERQERDRKETGERQESDRRASEKAGRQAV